MSDFSISEEIGVILLGFSIYDSAHQSWAVWSELPELQEGGFGWIRAGLMLLFCALIGISLALSHRSNVISAREGIVGLRTRDVRGLLRLIGLTALAQLVALSAIGFAYFGLGFRQAFLVSLGFAFANSGPRVNRWLAKT